MHNFFVWSWFDVCRHNNTVYAGQAYPVGHIYVASLNWFGNVSIFNLLERTWVCTCSPLLILPAHMDMQLPPLFRCQMIVCWLIDEFLLISCMKPEMHLCPRETIVNGMQVFFHIVRYLPWIWQTLEPSNMLWCCVVILGCCFVFAKRNEIYELCCSLYNYPSLLCDNFWMSISATYCTKL